MTTHEDKAKLIAWPHSTCLEPRAADALVENIAQALRDCERETLERAARVADKYPARNTLIKHEAQSYADTIAYEIRALGKEKGNEASS